MPSDTAPRSAPRLIPTPRFSDDRGWVCEAFNASIASDLGMVAQHSPQDNLTLTRAGALRGLHYQIDPAQAKLIRVLSGRIWDVAVDLRAGPGFGRWEGFWIGPESGALWIPAGYAHGFCVPEGEALVWYKLSHPRSPAGERVIAWDDPDLAIPWPIRTPILSPRDACGARLRDVAPLPARLG